jgi:hypothetical protein
MPHTSLKNRISGLSSSRNVIYGVIFACFRKYSPFSARKNDEKESMVRRIHD